MNFKTLDDQLNLSKNAIDEMNSQNRIFESLLQEAVKGAPESDKRSIENVRIKANQAIALCKQGKSEEAQEIIKELGNYGR